MEWAVRVAELRLWLNLLVDVEKGNIDIYTKPLLPNLSFKIRQGDSLVQEIFEKYVSLREPENLTPSIKRIIEELAKEHSRFFDGESERENIIKKLENDLVKKIFDEKLNQLRNEKGKIQNELKNLFDEYSNKVKMFGEDKKEREEFEKIVDNLSREKEKIDNEIEEYKNIYENLLRTKEKTYFLWDVCFSDVFKEKEGFDLVIGNPPYVRQELIGPPLIKNPSREQKDLYKKKLQESVEKTWGYKVGGRCDLYVYFYFQSLSLLNKKGTFCFINSNSWLDVDFGKYLQEFLLKNFEIKRIIDNQVKRSFKEADINTIMVLINYPEKEFLNNKVKFIMFKKPFDEVIKIDNELLIEEKDELFKNEDLRVFPKSQKELLLEGIEGDEQEEIKLLSGKYEGGKWGGIYLRAPDIYFTILEKGKGKFVKLRNIAKIRRGYIPYPLKLFLLTKEDIEKNNLEINNLYPAFSSPIYFKNIILESSDKYLLIFDNIQELENTNLLKWFLNKINELQISNKNISLKYREQSQIIIPRTIYERHIVYLNKGLSIIDHVELLIKEDPEIICCILNSSLYILLKEIYGRVGLGLGTLKFEVIDAKNLPFLELNYKFKKGLFLFRKLFKREILSVFQEFGLDSDKPIREQEPNPLPDRKELDDIVFDAIGLTEDERKEVYWAVAELVQNRLKKAKSV